MITRDNVEISIGMHIFKNDIEYVINVIDHIGGLIYVNKIGEYFNGTYNLSSNYYFNVYLKVEFLFIDSFLGNGYGPVFIIKQMRSEYYLYTKEHSGAFKILRLIDRHEDLVDYRSKAIPEQEAFTYGVRYD